jgi:general secretion pathway protein D
LSITPHIVRAPAIADNAVRDVYSGTEASVRENPLRLDPMGSVREGMGALGGAPAVMPAANPLAPTAAPSPAAPYVVPSSAPATPPAPVNGYPAVMPRAMPVAPGTPAGAPAGTPTTPSEPAQPDKTTVGALVLRRTQV